MPANNPNPCSVEDCGEKIQCRGFCWKHYTRWRRHGDPLAVFNVGPGRVAEVPTYDGLHRRIRRLYGSAKSHACVRCPRPARTWSYDHTDPAEIWDARRGHPYSCDVTRYRPMCSSCHSLFDAEMSRARG